MRSSIFRAVCAVVVGVLMIMYREELVRWLTIAIGVLFFLSGLLSVVVYCVARKKYNQALLRGDTHRTRKPMAPLVGVGCALLGIILAAIPDTVANYLVYVFAIILILGAIGQFFILATALSLLRDRERTASATVTMRCGYAYWLLPLLLFLFGLLALFYPHSIASAPFLFIGVAMLVYGVSEMVSALKAGAVRKYVANSESAPDATPAVETPVALEAPEAPVAEQQTIEEAEIIDDNA